MRVEVVRHELVELAPKVLEPGVLYVSPKYKTSIHLCCCGCGEKVVTPLSAAEWQVSVSRTGVTLFPSVGNWSMGCRSHYWISNGRVNWAGSFSKKQIQAVQKRDKEDLDTQYLMQTVEGTADAGGMIRWLRILVNWLAGK